MIPYHGGPITPETCAFRVWRGRHAFVSWFDYHQIELVASCCQSFGLDNGAYSFWMRQQEDPSFPSPHWPDYYAWTAKWLRHPACDWGPPSRPAATCSSSASSGRPCPTASRTSCNQRSHWRRHEACRRDSKHSKHRGFK